jgi:hypothetical protein
VERALKGAKAIAHQGGLADTASPLFGTALLRVFAFLALEVRQPFGIRMDAVARVDGNAGGTRECQSFGKYRVSA